MTFTFDADKHEYRRDGKLVLSVTQVLAKSGICDFSAVDEETRIRSMKRGQSVHWLLQLEDEGALNYRTVPKGLRGYRKAYKTWKDRSQFHVLGVEESMFSPLGFAGTVDRYGTFPSVVLGGHGSSAVLDFKTGPVADWTRYQLAAYAVLCSPSMSLARYMRRIALSLKSDGSYKVTEFPLCTFDVDLSKFIHALRKVTDAGNGAGIEAGSADGSSTGSASQDRRSSDLR